MVYSKNILSALFAASVVFAQSSSNDCSPSDAFTVNNQQDANTVSACGKFGGDINIVANAGATLDFGKVTEISGTVNMTTDNLITSLKFTSLTKLGGLNLNNLTRLSALDFSSLKTVGDLTLLNLAALNNFNFNQKFEEAKSVSIQNVQVAQLGGISAAQKIGDITLSNCQYLTTISFNISTVGTVNIGPNNVVQAQTVSFPSLTSATTLNFRNSSSVSTPMLASVSDTLGLYGNNFKTFGANNLTWVGALAVYSNAQLANLSFPALMTVNGTDSATLDIENNTALVGMAFPKLELVTGDVILNGNIANLSLPALKEVDGAMTVRSTNSKFDCSSVDTFGSSQVVKGSETCKADDATAIGTTNNGEGSSTGSSDSSSSTKNAAASVELPAFLTTGLFAALLAFLA